MWSDTYINEITNRIRQVQRTQIEKINSASVICADSIGAGRAALVFGAGHSALPCMEAFPRIGSFVGFYQIVEPALGYNSLVVGKGGQRQMSFLERTSGYAKVILSNYALKPEDSIVVFSHSGINALPVEMALECRSRGMRAIGVTSFAHSTVNAPDASIGRRLFEVCDVAIDTCAPEGDALLRSEGGKRFASASTISSMVIMNAIIARTAELLLERKVAPFVYPSHNISENMELMVEEEERMFDAYSRLQAMLVK